MKMSVVIKYILIVCQLFRRFCIFGKTGERVDILFRKQYNLINDEQRSRWRTNKRNGA